ncbi:calmodulin-binding motif domain-containing protein, partial [Reticulomyxa filosa]
GRKKKKKKKKCNEIKYNIIRKRLEKLREEEEEEKAKKQREEEEKAKKLREEEEKAKKQREEEEKARQQREEERAKRLREEEEKAKRQREEEEKAKRLREEEEKAKRQREEEEEKARKQREDEDKSKKQLTERERMKQMEREDRLRREQEKFQQTIQPSSTSASGNAEKKEYNIWFIVDLQRTDKVNIDSSTLGSSETWIKHLQGLFDGKVIDVRTRVKTTNLSVINVKFGVNIQLSEHPQEYIDRFETLTKDKTFQQSVQNALGNAFTLDVTIWEASYEKISH